MSYNPFFDNSVSVTRNGVPTTMGLSTVQTQVGQERADFIKSDATLGEHERKYCRCLLHVEEKGNAYNPYGVCTRSTGSQVHSCSQYYDFSAMNLGALNAYASLHKISGYDRTDRQAALDAINQWKTSLRE